MSSINSYEWKDRRIGNSKTEKQVRIPLVSMSNDQLQYCYNTCKDMLYNSDPKLPGRMIVLNRIAEQKDICVAERCYRWFLSLTNSDGKIIYPNGESLLSDLRDWKNELTTLEDPMLKDFLEVPAEFRKVRLSKLEQACTDSLGAFDHSKISFSFIYDLGIYLTQEELKEIDKDLRKSGLNPEDYTLQQKIDNHVKVPLGISESEIRINPRGLTLGEFQSMINMKHYKGFKMCKYSNLSTAQLVTLSTKVLYALEHRVKAQAAGWKERMAQIEEVAEYKHYKLS